MSGRLNDLTTEHRNITYTVPGTGLYAARLADTVPATLNGDYGSDYCAMSYIHLQKYADAGIFVQILPLSQPLSVIL